MRKMNDSGLSPVLGMVLVLAIIVGAIGIIQQFFVPAWVKNDEWNHYTKLRHDFSSIPKLIALTASSGNPNVVTLDLKVDRGNYPFLMSLPDTGTFLKAEKERIWVNYTERLPNGSITNPPPLKLTTRALIAEPKYYYLPDEKFFYEHSLVFVRSSGNVTLVEQSAFTNRSFTIYIFNTDFDSISSSDVIAIPLIPISYGGEISVVNATIKFQSLYPEYWNRKLSEMGIDVSTSGNIVTVNLTDTILRIAVLATDPSAVKLVYKPYLYFSELTTFVGDTEIIEVLVRDQFGNPVPNVQVNGSATIGSLDSASVTTDANGIARFVFKAPQIPDTGTITFEVKGEKTQVNVTVISPGENLWDKNTNNDTLVTSPDFKWAGIHDASEIWLRNATQISTKEDKLDIYFTLYNSTTYYYFEVHASKAEDDKIWIWKYKTTLTQLLNEEVLDPSKSDDIFTSDGINIIDPTYYKDCDGKNSPKWNSSKCRDIRDALSQVKWFLQNATLRDPISLAIQDIKGWAVEIQII